MKDLNGKTAVVTGAASGIGRALADRCVSEGMKVVLADIEESALARAENELKASGARVLAVRTDVSKLEDVRKLADGTLSAFGAVHLLFNNAGVAPDGLASGPIWRATTADWQWVLGVNLWGVIYGLQVFVPIMLAQDAPGHIVNTASMVGLISSNLGTYAVSKHAVVSLSEALYRDLAAIDAKVKASVLCPGMVNTGIADAVRNRPAELLNDASTEDRDPALEAQRARSRQALAAASAPSEVADKVFAAIREDVFYILPHGGQKPAVERRMRDILSGHNPTLAQA